MIKCSIPDETVSSTLDAVKMIGQKFVIVGVESVNNVPMFILSCSDGWIETLDELLEAAECAHDWFSGCQVDGIDGKHESSVAASEKLRQAIANTKAWQELQ